MRVGLFHRIWEFCQDEGGSDRLELALTIAFVLLGSTALYAAAGADLHGIRHYPDLEVAHACNG